MRIGIDLGGTKTEVLALADDSQVLLRRRIPSPQGDYAATISMLIALVESVESELGQRGSVGIGIPGAESQSSGLIKNANSTWLIGRPLKADLQLALSREVRLANDANCFTLSEASDGAAEGFPVVFGVILGTGVGGGIVVNGKAIQGANAIAGEWGHCHLGITVPESPFEPDCYCGRKGCVETYLSGPGLAADHSRVAQQNLNAETIVMQAAAGDVVCEATLRRYEARLAFALAQIINVLDPDAIVLGGGLSNIERLYINVPQQWGAHVFSDTVQTRLLRNVHGDSSGVRGAAWLWPVRA